MLGFVEVFRHSGVSWLLCGFLFRLVGLGVVFLVPGVHGNERLGKDIENLFAQGRTGSVV